MLRVAVFLQSMIWLMNGLYCKALGLVPRHEAIVARILGESHAAMLTRLIGFGEILFSIWIASFIRPRTAILLQIVLVAGMNITEAILAPDLLLFGYWNAVLAVIFILVLAFCYRAFPSDPGPLSSH